MEISAEEVQGLRYAVRLIQLSTDLFSAICRHADECPQGVLSAAEDWYCFLSEVAPPTEATDDG